MKEQFTDAQIADLLRRSYFVVDGLWFVKTEEKHGFEEAMDLDQAVWDPNADRAIKAHYSLRKRGNKAACRRALLAELGAMLRPARELLDLSIPHDQAAIISRLHACAQVVERHYDGSSARFKAWIPPHLRNEFEQFTDGGDSGKAP